MKSQRCHLDPHIKLSSDQWQETGPVTKNLPTKEPSGPDGFPSEFYHVFNPNTHTLPKAEEWRGDPSQPTPREPVTTKPREEHHYKMNNDRPIFPKKRSSTKTDKHIKGIIHLQSCGIHPRHTRGVQHMKVNVIHYVNRRKHLMIISI